LILSVDGEDSDSNKTLQNYTLELKFGILRFWILGFNLGGSALRHTTDGSQADFRNRYTPLDKFRELHGIPDVASEIKAVIPDYDCGPPLIEALITGQEDVVNLLLEKGAHPSRDLEAGTPGTWGYYVTTVEAAAANGHKEILRLFIGQGADINFDNNGNRMTAMRVAAMEGEVEMLIQFRANLNASSGKVGTPIQTVACHGHTRIVEILIVAGADVNARGQSQMHCYDEGNEVN
jgi:hypothetical protein